VTEQWSTWTVNIDCSTHSPQQTDDHDTTSFWSRRFLSSVHSSPVNIILQSLRGIHVHYFIHVQLAHATIQSNLIFNKHPEFYSQSNLTSGNITPRRKFRFSLLHKKHNQHIKHTVFIYTYCNQHRRLRIAYLIQCSPSSYAFTKNVLKRQTRTYVP